MRVGTYVDGMNVYYGGRQLCGRGTPGWRWLDLEGLARRLIERNPVWAAAGATASRIVYCTAILDGEEHADSRSRHETYISALKASGTVEVELGFFRYRIVQGVDPTSDHPGTLKTLEEKGSDVNVASHMLIDLHTDRIDAAILISNDGDLKMPAEHVRQHIPLGMVNPRGLPTAQVLRGDRAGGAGGHWWYRLKANDLLECQLPPQVGAFHKPAGW